MNTLNKAEYENVIKDAILKCAGENGWANLAEVGSYLKQNGIKYKKLSKFLSDYDHLIEKRVDESRQPPVVFAKLKVKMVQV